MRYFSDRLRNETNGIKIVTMLLVRCFVDSNVLWIFPFGSSVNTCQMLKHKKKSINKIHTFSFARTQILSVCFNAMLLEQRKT